MGKQPSVTHSTLNLGNLRVGCKDGKGGVDNVPLQHNKKMLNMHELVLIINFSQMKARNGSLYRLG